MKPRKIVKMKEGYLENIVHQLRKDVWRKGLKNELTFKEVEKFNKKYSQLLTRIEDNSYEYYQKGLILLPGSPISLESLYLSNMVGMEERGNFFTGLVHRLEWAKELEIISCHGEDVLSKTYQSGFQCDLVPKEERIFKGEDKEFQIRESHIKSVSRQYGIY